MYIMATTKSKDSLYSQQIDLCSWSHNIFNDLHFIFILK